MIFADPTELRKGTRLPDSVCEIAKPLSGLEAKTGADLLISPLKLPATTDSLLLVHCQSGMLIQRKSGMDFASSITDNRLYASLEKMLEYTTLPYLVVVGNIYLDGSDGIIAEQQNVKRIGKKAIITSEGRLTLHHNSLLGAIDWYEMRGGYVRFFANDDSFVMWVNKRVDFLKSIEKNEGVVKRIVRQEIVTSNQTATILRLLPGIDKVRSEIILNHYQAEFGHYPSVLDIMKWITDYGQPLPSGVPDSVRESAREYFGLVKDEKGLYQYVGDFYSVRGE